MCKQKEDREIVKWLIYLIMIASFGKQFGLFVN
ncbi:MAG: hypothetical protein MRERC_7c073 [Mycoplasmataceae bacterium RC_NB112A]|nr:MAG: hypothetical protein MRERC_8c072 [Mycoplasmataceae bacterium RC_NB112A]KLL01908.1 MAG: hypothetical protein MRERC_7c073 [Mycoplasmataceae bacterium RC_NB112A]